LESRLTILEIGSGKRVKGKYPYSYKALLERNNKVITTDIVPGYGHKVVDITTMRDVEQYDVIICLNVLEHVYEYKKAVANLHRALKKGGVLMFFSPYIYPLHDTPHDYFRFSEYALRRMFSGFSDIRIRHFGLKQMPHGYFVRALR